MEKKKKSNLEVISGAVRNVRVENTAANIFFRDGDREGMAATGVVAAAMGLSGIAAGMATMSAEDLSEPVCRVSFDLEGKPVNALLWSWPFNDGTVIQAVVERSETGYIALAVLDPGERIIVLYPNVSAGHKSHWKNVAKYSLGVAFVFSLVFSVLAAVVAYFAGGRNETAADFLFILVVLFLSGMALISWVGFRIGLRFSKFPKVAEKVFSALGWEGDIGEINLRKITKLKRKPSDPRALGDIYFRY